MDSMPKYQSYRKSGLRWIEEIPENWELKKIKFCTKLNQKTLPENTLATLPVETIKSSV